VWVAAKSLSTRWTRWRRHRKTCEKGLAEGLAVAKSGRGRPGSVKAAQKKSRQRIVLQGHPFRRFKGLGGPVKPAHGSGVFHRTIRSRAVRREVSRASCQLQALNKIYFRPRILRPFPALLTLSKDLLNKPNTQFIGWSFETMNSIFYRASIPFREG
jgi:hypothetical protein